MGLDSQHTRETESCRGKGLATGHPRVSRAELILGLLNPSVETSSWGGSGCRAAVIPGCLRDAQGQADVRAEPDLGPGAADS